VAGSGLVRTGAGTAADPYRVGLITTCTTGQLLKWSGTAWVCSADIDTNTDQQNLNLTGTTLSISGGNSVNLAPFLDNTDNQALAWTPGTRTLTLTNGGSVVIADANTTYTADNGLTMTGTNTQLGGTLLHDTTVAQAGYKVNFTGGEFMSQRQGSGSNYYTFQSGDNLMSAGIGGIMTAVTPNATYAGGKATYQWLSDGMIMTTVQDTTTNQSNIVTTPAAVTASASDGTRKTELVLNNAGTASLSSYDSGLAFNGNHSQFVFNSNGTASITSKGTAGAMRTVYDPTRIVFSDYTTGTDVPRFTIDNAARRVVIGSTVTDAVAMALVLDSYNVATDPAGTNGAMYYNTALAKFRCYENSAWKNCIGGSSLSGKTTAVTVPVAAATTHVPGTATQTVTFATARPTATYNVICTANTAVTCSVTARTTAGFTVTFSNPNASTAAANTVADWFIAE
ncbi:MAG TPA: hypothetical protein PKD28_02760, partial [Candidatus Saccharibacteria bacterium]|nr:hypothetical protein [Candidatus Saccharibacteria bacterium]